MGVQTIGHPPKKKTGFLIFLIKMASQFGQLSPLPPIRLLSVSLATKSVTRDVGILCLESIPSECILGEPTIIEV